MTDERLALDVVQTVWPMLGYLQAAPARLRIEIRIAMSHTMWDTLLTLKLEPGIRPVDPLNMTLFGIEVVINNWPRDRVELVIPVAQP